MKVKVKCILRAFPRVIAHNLYNAHWIPFKYFWHVNSSFDTNSAIFLVCAKPLGACVYDALNAMAQKNCLQVDCCNYQKHTSLRRVAFVLSIEMALIGLVNKAFKAKVCIVLTSYKDILIADSYQLSEQFRLFFRTAACSVWHIFYWRVGFQ